MHNSLWENCLQRFQHEIPEQQYNTWIKPLRVLGVSDANELCLQAPNHFIKDWVDKQFLKRISELLNELSAGQCQRASLQAGGETAAIITAAPINSEAQSAKVAIANIRRNPAEAVEPVQANQVGATSASAQAYAKHSHNGGQAFYEGIKNPPPKQDMQPSARVSFIADARSETTKTLGNTSKSVGLIANYIFDNFVEGKSNQLARAAAQQVAENPGGAYNPVFLYGGVGLGKTHLMHAIGNALRARNPDARVVYLHSERFVADMVKALQLNAINDFKRYYRSVDALLIDDIQFFAGKDRSQEEFFHTFNALLEGGHQIILTSDRYPKEINGLEERLRSRFGWGLTVEVMPPELETRVAILLQKAQETGMDLPNDAAFFIAQRIRANVRDLEGALKRVKAHSVFANRAISIELVQEALRDLFSLHDRLINISNIQKTVAEHYKIKLAELMSKKRSRSIARPRQVAMALAKELTSHSLPEIGESFGGRDHTTVLHACRKIAELRESNTDVKEDYEILLRLLTT